MSKLEEFIKTFKIEKATEVVERTSKTSDNDRIILSGPGWEYSYHYIRGFDSAAFGMKMTDGQLNNSFILGSIHVFTVDFAKLSSMGKKGVVNYIRNIFVGNADCRQAFCLDKTVDQIADYINEHLDNDFCLIMNEERVSLKDKKINFIVETYQGTVDGISFIIADKYRLYDDFIDDVSGIGSANAYDIHVAILLFGVLNFLKEDSLVVFGDWYKNIHVAPFGMPNLTEYLTIIALGQVGGIVEETDYAAISFDEKSLTLYEFPDEENENNGKDEENEVNSNSYNELTKFLDSLFGENPKDQRLINRVLDAIDIYLSHDYEDYILHNHDELDSYNVNKDNDETQGDTPTVDDIINSILLPTYYAIGSVSTGKCFIMESPNYTNVNIKYPDGYLVFPSSDYLAAETAASNFQKIIHNMDEFYRSPDDDEDDDPE